MDGLYCLINKDKILNNMVISTVLSPEMSLIFLDTSFTQEDTDSFFLFDIRAMSRDYMNLSCAIFWLAALKMPRDRKQLWRSILLMSDSLLRD